MIAVKGVSKAYRLGKVMIPALRDVSLDIGEREFVAVRGPSGSGKSTLLNLVGLLDRPDDGSISFLGERVDGMGDAKLSGVRNRKIGFIFQSFNLIPVLSAFENVEYPLTLMGETGRVRRKKVSALFEEIGMADLMRRRPDELSGGQRQRVAIARALVTDPPLVLADEPTASLDHATGERIVDLMKRLRDKNGCAFLFTSHDPAVVAHAERVVTLADGEIVPS